MKAEVVCMDQRTYAFRPNVCSQRASSRIWMTRPAHHTTRYRRDEAMLSDPFLLGADKRANSREGGHCHMDGLALPETFA